MRALLRFLSSLLIVILAFGTVELATTKWPAGTYGIPRAVSGCPPSTGFTWHTGWRYQDTEDVLPSNRHSSNFHLDASVANSNLKRTFCMKTDKAGDASRSGWPKGKYCIYKKGSCPSGLKSGYITWDDEDWFNKNNKGGVLPDGVYDQNTKIYYCCRTDGNKVEPIQLPTNKPFFLVAYESAPCQQVKWAQVSSEWIRYDTEKDDDGYGGAYPYGAGMNDHTIHYCYYTSCNFTLTASTGSFQSPNYPNSYPAGQYCSWRIKVPEGLQVLLKFPKFTLERGINTDNIQLYDGQNETSPSLGVYSGNKAPSPSGVRSSSNELFVIFKTDNKSNFGGFQASYSAQRPTQPPSTVTTTSTVRTTNAATTSAKTTKAPKTTGQQLSTKPAIKTTATRTSTTASAPTTAQTTHFPTTAQANQVPTEAQTTHAPTTVQITQVSSKAQTTHALTTTTIKSTTNNAGSASTTTARPTTGNTKGTARTTSSQPSRRPTTGEIKETTVTVDTDSTGSSETKATNEPTDTRPTENDHSTLEVSKNESWYSYRKIEQGNGSSNVALILVPVLCLLLIGVCLLIVFIYRRRNPKRKDEECNQFVYFESNPKTESVDNPLYDSAVKFSDDSMENPRDNVEGECAVNRLYDSKLEIKQFYDNQGARKPKVSLESRDIMECVNPMYDSGPSPNESVA